LQEFLLCIFSPQSKTLGKINRWF